MGGEGLPGWLASRAASARVSCPLQGGKGGKPSIKTTSSSRSKPLKGKRVGAGSGSIADELLSRLGETIQVGHALALLSTQCCRWLFSNWGCLRTDVAQLRVGDGARRPGWSTWLPLANAVAAALPPPPHPLRCAGHARGLHCGAPAGALLLLPRVHERGPAVRRHAPARPAVARNAGGCLHS